MMHDLLEKKNVLCTETIKQIIDYQWEITTKGMQTLFLSYLCLFYIPFII